MAVGPSSANHRSAARISVAFIGNLTALLDVLAIGASGVLAYIACLQPSWDKIDTRYIAAIGAGAVISRDVPPFSVAVGNPAVIRENARSSNLEYDPVEFVASYRAWVGATPLMKSAPGVITTDLSREDWLQPAMTDGKSYK